MSPSPTLIRFSVLPLRAERLLVGSSLRTVSSLALLLVGQTFLSASRGGTPPRDLSPIDSAAEYGVGKQTGMSAPPKLCLHVSTKSTVAFTNPRSINVGQYPNTSRTSGRPSKYPVVPCGPLVTSGTISRANRSTTLFFESIAAIDRKSV